MIDRVLDFSVRARWLVVALTALVAAYGFYEISILPIDALPDVSPVQVSVLTGATGLSPVEVERTVTIPITDDILIEGDKLTVRIDPASDVYSVDYKRGTPDQSDAMRVSIERNFQAARPAKVTTAGWDERKKAKVHSTANVSGVGSTREYHYEHHGVSPERASKHSKAKAKEHARHEFVCTVKIAGDLTVNRAKKLRLTGNIYAQDYDIESVSHEIAQHGGFVTSISAKSAKKGRKVK